MRGLVVRVCGITALCCCWALGPLVTIIGVFLGARLRALMEMCILIPGISSKLRQNGGTIGQASSLFEFWALMFMQNWWLIEFQMALLS